MRAGEMGIMVTFFESDPTNKTKTCFALAIGEFATTYLGKDYGKDWE